jgi:NADH dehydrogenase
MHQAGSGTDGRQRVVVVGGGFAGYHALRRLRRLLPERDTELVLVTPNDYLLYTPLLPEVAAGTIEPRHIAIALRPALPGVRLVLARAVAVDTGRRTVALDRPVAAAEGPEGRDELRWDRLVLVPGSVTRQFPISGLSENAHALKTLVEAVYLRDHLLVQLDLADACPQTAAGDRERRRLLTVVAVGAGYTGTEYVAQAQLWLRRLEGRWDRTKSDDVRWILADLAPAVLPELGGRLGRYALDVLRRRGVDVRLGTTVSSVGPDSVALTDGTVVETRTVIWGAGVAPNPLVGTVGAPLDRGRLVVDATLRVPSVPGVWAAGDAAAVPDLTARPAGAGPTMLPPTAQHAQRQGRILARNVAASYGKGRPRAYRHRDLGLVADLGGTAAVARPLGVPLTGRPAKALARAYHLYALPEASSRLRVLTDWALGAVLAPQEAQLGLAARRDALIPAAQLGAGTVDGQRAASP